MPTVFVPHGERGTLVVGPPGSGKTFSTIDPMLHSAFEQGMSVLLYDKKGDQMKLHTALATRYGYEVSVFAPGEDYSAVINPLDFIRDPTDATTAGELADVFIKSTSSGGKGDEFFKNSGTMLAKGLMQLAKSSIYPDLAMVYAIAQLPNLVQRLAYAVEKGKLDPWIQSTFSNFLSSKDAEKTVAGIKSTAELVFTGFIQKDLLRAFIGKSTIPLYLKPKQLIVFKLDDRRRSVIAPLLAVAIHLCIVENLAEKRKNPFVYCLDEFPSLGKFERIVNFVNEYRSNGGVPIIGIQSFNQLYETYGEKNGASIIEALKTHFIFGTSDIKAAEQYSKLFGETTIKTKTRSYSRNTGARGGGGSVSYSEQIHKVPLIPVDQIYRFPQGKCILSSPAYGNNWDSNYPWIQKIPLPQRQIKIWNESEELWDSTIRPALVQREQSLAGNNLGQDYIDLTLLGSEAERDWVTSQLNLRVAEAENLLPPVPESAQKSSS